ncbi:MAG: peptide ABC transporter substrate-binding protein [Pseudomonadales bacterium]|nr:peptide ABC transporter substrate-binding protein [Pseudomonadales bacterium]MDG1444063.1 peptide ABC transporter substrate-binding protein [Pseudomonadales bacterium]
MLISLVMLLSLFALAIFPVATCAKAIDDSESSITLALGSEPPNIDSNLSSDVISAQILSLTNEGLVRTNKRGQTVPGMAERWTLDGMTLTFYLREANWSNGSPVTARDFSYAFRRLVDPKTGAGGSTFFAYMINNATDILAGKKQPSELGVRAIDDKTFEITLSQPTPYALIVLGGVNYMPLSQKFVEQQADTYGADAGKTLSNGPFILTGWKHSSSLSLVANPDYWDSKNVHLNAINFGYITNDTRALLNLYQSDQLAALRLNEDILQDTITSGARIRTSPTNCLSWVMMNMDESKVTSNIKLRQAIRLALDREAYVNKIVGLPGSRKVDSVFTKRMRSTNGSFQADFPATPIIQDIPRAKALLEEAKLELGLQQLPPLVMLANESRQIEAEFVQSQLINNLGLDVKVDKQTFKQSLVKFRQGEFDLARSGFCGGALQDPVFFAGIFASNSPYNDMNFKNAEYDRLMKLTHETDDQQARMQAFGRMQDILYEQVPMIPTLESAWVYVQSNRLKGVTRYPVAVFSRGRIIAESP